MKVKLKDICEVKNGYAFKSDNYTTSGIRVIRITNVQKGFVEDEHPEFYPFSYNDELNDYMLYENDLLISLTGNVGRVALINKEFLPAALNQRVACLRPDNKKVLNKYLFYYLLSKKFENDCIKYSKGIAQKNMSTEWLKEYELDIVSINEQNSIICIFDKLYRIINKYKILLNHLDTLIKARFVEMFGDSPNNKYYSIKLGEVSISKGEYGANSASIAFTDNRARYIRITDINDDGTLNNDKVASINVSDDVKYKLEYGDIIFARTGATVGKSYCYQTNENQIFAGYLIKFKINVDKMVPVFIFYNTKMKYYDEWVKNSQGGAAQPNINEKKYSSFELINPPIDLQQQFAVFVKEVDKLKFE